MNRLPDVNAFGQPIEEEEDHRTPSGTEGADEELECPNCGRSIRVDDITCPHCGIALVGG